MVRVELVMAISNKKQNMNDILNELQKLPGKLTIDDINHPLFNKIPTNSVSKYNIIDDNIDQTQRKAYRIMKYLQNQNKYNRFKNINDVTPEIIINMMKQDQEDKKIKIKRISSKKITLSRSDLDSSWRKQE